VWGVGESGSRDRLPAEAGQEYTAAVPAPAPINSYCKRNEVCGHGPPPGWHCHPHPHIYPKTRDVARPSDHMPLIRVSRSLPRPGPRPRQKQRSGRPLKKQAFCFTVRYLGKFHCSTGRTDVGPPESVIFDAKIEHGSVRGNSLEVGRVVA
jgi:hypothetical protein